MCASVSISPHWSHCEDSARQVKLIEP
eukprot:COSAG06_NODE_24699_length_655_cov_0.791367_1_plen_26_part_10